MTEFLLYLYAESPVHPGAAGALDVLDLPVQREAATGYPVIWGQSLKGALRQAAREDGVWDAELVTAVFGSDVTDRRDGGSAPGLLAVGDAQLVAMPVPTLRKTFAWLTSEIALGRLARKYVTLGHEAEIPAVPEAAEDRGLASGGWKEQAEDGTWRDSAPAGEVLGPYVVPLGDGPDENLTAWAGKLAKDAFREGGAFKPFSDKLRTDLVLAGANLMPTLLKECTELAVRVQLSTEQKTVEHGPFYSEYLPAETILAAALTLRSARCETPADRHEAHEAALRQLLDGKLLRVGGDETLGKGLVWARLLQEGQPQ